MVGVNADYVASKDVHGRMMSLDHRRAIAERFRTGKLDLVANPMLWCLDAQTEILTSRGFLGIDELGENDDVANWDDGFAYFEKPQRIIRRERHPGERMVKLETPRRSIRVTENHNMLYRTSRDGNFLKMQAGKMVGKACELPVSGHAPRVEISPEQPPSLSDQHRARLVSALSHRLRKVSGMARDESIAEAARRVERKYARRYKEPHELALHECGLIGFWLGDGSCDKLSRGGVEYKLFQSLRYPRVIKWIDATLEACGIHNIKRLKSAMTNKGFNEMTVWSLPRGTGGGSQERSGVFAIEPYLDKRGSALLWGLNEAQFDAMVQGLWRADGFHGAAEQIPKTLQIVGVRYDLFSLLQAIAVCRGYRATLFPIQLPDGSPHQQQYRLSMEKEVSHRLTKFRMEYEDGWQQERVWCVTVSSGSIITRRRGTVTVMGNCEGVDLPFVDTIINLRMTKSTSLLSQMLGRATRLFEGKDHCLFIDLSCVTNIELASVVDLFDDSNRSDAVMKKAKELVKDGTETDVQRAIEKAEEMHEAEIKIRLRERAARGQHTIYDPLAALESLGFMRKENQSSWFDTNPADPADAAWLDAYYNKPSKDGRVRKEMDTSFLTFYEAKNLKSKTIKRIKSGLCNHRQIALLVRFGMPQAEAANVKFADVSKTLDQLQSRPK